jgi:hypothetical protein
MGEEKEVYSEKLKHKGFFKYSDLYNFCFNWFKDEGYKVSEKEYTEKVGGGKEIQIKWEAGKKVTDYYKYIIEAKWHILGLVDAEAEQNGKKVKTNSGEVKIEVKAKLKRDYEETWDKSPFYKFLRGIYDKYIMRTTEDAHETELTAKAEKFVEETKAYLNLEGMK